MHPCGISAGGRSGWELPFSVGDIRLPDRPRIESPGFQIHLTGKGVTMQDRLEYRKAHRSEPVCERFLNKPDVDR